MCIITFYLCSRKSLVEVLLKYIRRALPILDEYKECYATDFVSSLMVFKFQELIQVCFKMYMVLQITFLISPT
jgi:hypothetical protein